MTRTMCLVQAKLAVAGMDLNKITMQMWKVQTMISWEVVKIHIAK